MNSSLSKNELFKKTEFKKLCFILGFKRSEINLLLDNIDKNLLENPFLHVNAPAIAYPFLRAYIANLLLISGYDPLMLPSINFDAMWKSRTIK